MLVLSNLTAVSAEPTDLSIPSPHSSHIYSFCSDLLVSRKVNVTVSAALSARGCGGRVVEGGPSLQFVQDITESNDYCLHTVHRFSLFEELQLGPRIPQHS